ncbi:Nitroimidazol reductase NimA [Peptoniphilus sp. ING2-D1G]|nr:Nitroimidazol reductase NimA [Peptoniphilus sp. ING2-D1G]
MFREMRRFKQKLKEDKVDEILEKSSSGVLSLIGDEGYPYGVPLSYAYTENKLIFHTAKTGHKIDAIKNNSKASFTIIEKDQIVPEEYTTYFRSAILFGKVKIIEDRNLKLKYIKILSEKYSIPGDPGQYEEIDKLFEKFEMIEFQIEHKSGKEAKELANKQKSQG